MPEHSQGDDESRAGMDNASDAGSARIGSSGDRDMRPWLSLPFSDGVLTLPPDLGTTPVPRPLLNTIVLWLIACIESPCMAVPCQEAM